MATLSLSLLEIAVLLFGAIILGATIHYFISGRTRLPDPSAEIPANNSLAAEWQHRYAHDMGLRELEINKLKAQLRETDEDRNIYMIEAEELNTQKKQLQQEIGTLRLENDRLKAEIASKAAAPVMTGHAPDYLRQLQQAQAGLSEQNQKINELLGTIDIIREKEEMQRDIEHSNEELQHQVDDLRRQLADKETEISRALEKEKLAREMSAVLDSTYQEFEILQARIQKLEAQAGSSQLAYIEHEDLKETYYRVEKDLEESRSRLKVALNDNQVLQDHLAEAEAKLSESNAQRQQLQKKVAYLEELNKDLQVMAEANKKLESQLRRIGELESMLNMVSDQRDQLMKK